MDNLKTVDEALKSCYSFIGWYGEKAYRKAIRAEVTFDRTGTIDVLDYVVQAAKGTDINGTWMGFDEAKKTAIQFFKMAYLCYAKQNDGAAFYCKVCEVLNEQSVLVNIEEEEEEG